MKILGFMKVILLPLMILVITTGSSIASPTPRTGGPTSEENTSCRRESQREEEERLRQSQIGKSTMEVLTNLNKILKIMEDRLSEEKSSPSTQPLEK